MLYSGSKSYTKSKAQTMTTSSTIRSGEKIKYSRKGMDMETSSNKSNLYLLAVLSMDWDTSPAFVSNL